MENENVTRLPGTIATNLPGRPDPDVIQGLKHLLAMAEAGEVGCVIGAALLADKSSIEYSFGDPGTGIMLIGQLDMASAVLKGRAMASRRMAFKPY